MECFDCKITKFFLICKVFLFFLPYFLCFRCFLEIDIEKV